MIQMLKSVIEIGRVRLNEVCSYHNSSLMKCGFHQGAIMIQTSGSLLCKNHPNNMTEDNFNFQTFSLKVKDS